MRKQFKREQRYFVVKVKDAKEYLDAHQLEKLAEIADTISEGREKDGIPAVESVVVESDWPEYESTWRAIEDRVTGAQPAPIVPEGWKLVPIEPTPEMMLVAQKADHDHGDHEEWLEYDGEDVKRVYRAMLAAAPEAKP